ncbi:MAG TPA: hypothetical protein VI456_07025 [Polyangia bacterium]
MRLTRLWRLGFMLATIGCHPGSSAPPPPTDAGALDLAVDLPPGCPPATANSKGVGIPCTRGGGECKKPGVPGGLLCTCDPLPILGIVLNGVPCVCTIGGPNGSASATDPCSQAANGLQPGFCGSDATCCPYLTTAFYCSPNECLPGGSCIDFTTDSGT